MILKIILLTCTSFLSNTLWAFYIKSISDDKMFKASIYGELIVGAGALSTYMYVNDPIMIIPLLVGGFFGTLMSKRIKQFFKIDK